MPSLFGMPAHQNLQLSAISLASLLTSFLVLIVSHLSAQEAGRLSRDLATPSSSTTYLTTSLTWLCASSLVSVLSTLILTVIAWLEIQSMDQPSKSLWLLVPPLLLITLPLIQTLMYQVPYFCLSICKSDVFVPDSGDDGYDGDDGGDG